MLLKDIRSIFFKIRNVMISEFDAEFTFINIFGQGDITYRKVLIKSDLNKSIPVQS